MSDPRIQVRAATLDFSDPALRAEVERAILECLEWSFDRWPVRHRTREEEKRRFMLLFEGYRVLRNEEHFSSQRAIDYFPRILKAALDQDSSATKGNRRRSTWFATGDV